MEIFKPTILILLVIGFWAIPIVFGIRFAKKKNISPHWLWFGIHPFFGWITFAIIAASKGRKSCPKCLEVLKMHAKVCAYCNHPFDDFTNQKSTEDIIQSRKKKRSRNLIIGIGTLLIVILYVILIVNIGFTSTWAYKNAMKTAQENTDLQIRLGKPISKGFFMSGSVSSSGSSGKADLTIPIKGSNGKGELIVDASKNKGKWSMDKLLFIDGENKDTVMLNSPNTIDSSY